MGSRIRLQIDVECYKCGCAIEEGQTAIREEDGRFRHIHGKCPTQEEYDKEC